MKEKHLFIILYIFIVFLLAGCEDEKPVTEALKKDFRYSVVKEDYSGNFIFSSVDIKTDINQDHIKGLLLSYSPDLNRKDKQLKHSFIDFGYKAYVMKVKFFHKDGKPVKSRKAGSKKKNENLEYESGFQHLRSLRTSIFIPYYALDIPTDVQDLIIRIEGYRADIDSVKNPSGFGYAYRRRSEKPDAVMDIALHYKQPLVKEGSLRVCRFCINPEVKDPHTYDYRVLGSGYPDLFWELKIGNQLIYTSPIEKNRIVYEICYNTPAFYFSEKDSIKLLFWDHDELSKPDFVGEWIVSPYAMHEVGEDHPEKMFDNVKDCKIVLDLIEDDE